MNIPNPIKIRSKPPRITDSLSNFLKNLLKMDAAINVMIKVTTRIMIDGITIGTSITDREKPTAKPSMLVAMETIKRNKRLSL